jgi:general secretion pathway protein D
MKKAASEMKVKPPLLDPKSKEPMSLSFPNPTNVKDIYSALGQAFGINVVYDPRLKDNKITIDLRDVTAERALEMVMQAAGHFYKVLDEGSVIIVEDTPQNRRDYEDLVVKTFFLSNADVKDVNNSIRALIDARRLSVNEQLNSLVIRDTADKVAIAERLIAANDKSRAEVLIDVELIQVDASKLRDIGMSLSSSSYPITFDPSAITGSTTNRVPLDRLSDITRSMWGVIVPNVTVSLVKSAGEAETLAQPQLRITEGEKGNLVIGDKVRSRPRRSTRRRPSAATSCRSPRSSIRTSASRSTSSRACTTTTRSPSSSRSRSRSWARTCASPRASSSRRSAPARSRR